MGIVHFINGQDGGVGKSTTFKVIADYCIEKKISLSLFDADRKEDVYRIYQDKYPIQQAIFNEGEEYQNSANTIYDEALSNNVLVNLPANVFHSLADWFVKNGIFETAEETEVAFYNWFVTDGDPDKIINLEQNLDFFGDRSKRNILVQNYGKRKDWSDFNKHKTIKKLIKSYELTVLEFPKLLGNLEKDIISQKFLTFTEAKVYKFSSSISNSRIRSFVRQSFKILDESKIFSSHAMKDNVRECSEIKTIASKESDRELAEAQRASSEKRTINAELNGKYLSTSIDVSSRK